MKMGCIAYMNKSRLNQGFKGWLVENEKEKIKSQYNCLSDG